MVGHFEPMREFFLHPSTKRASISFIHTKLAVLYRDAKNHGPINVTRDSIVVI